MMLSILIAAAFAHPSSLECGTDATSRLALGSIVMNGPVTAPPADGCTCCPVSAVYHKATQELTVLYPLGIYYAVRVFGGATIEVPASPELARTANCSSQVYTKTPTSEGRGYSYHVAVVPPIGRVVDYITVGWTDGMSGPGLYVVNATIV